MGTRYNISVVAEANINVDAVQEAVDLRLEEINRQMSTYDPESELSRFNADSQVDAWFAVSPDTARVAAAAIDYAERTSCAFDPTVSPAVDLWGFGPVGRRRTPPDDAEVTAVRQRIGYDRVAVRREPAALRKSSAEAALDLSAIAKGFAVDELSELLADRGIDRSMVEIGGEVVTRGVKPDGSSWRIGIERPTSGGREIGMIVELAGALASSGDYRNFFEAENVRYSHTIDPRTARPVTHQLATVTVCTPTCLEADALATALMVMGPEKGYDWCLEHQIAALFQMYEDGTIQERATPEFEQLIVRQVKPVAR